MDNQNETSVDVSKLTQELAAAQARLLVLENAGKLPKKAASDAEFFGAIAKLQTDAKSDLDSGNPKARPALNLSSVLGFIPNPMTKEQREAWKAAKSAMEKAHSNAHRQLLPQRRKTLEKVLRNPASLAQTVAKVRKDGTHSRVSISASEPRKAQRKSGRGKNAAKPAQVAAHVPVAGNAATPASVS